MLLVEEHAVRAAVDAVPRLRRVKGVSIGRCGSVLVAGSPAGARSWSTWTLEEERVLMRGWGKR